jgi:membrane-associated phospholipid phosphatase
MKTRARTFIAAALLAGSAMSAQADVVTEWNVKAGELVVEAKLGTPPANRTMAIVQTAVFEAVNGITRRYADSRPQPAQARGASVEAAVAAANRATLAQLLPQQKAAIDRAYQAALASIAEGPAKAAGIAVGEAAAATVLASRADDRVAAPDAYRPHTAAGLYIPTVTPAAPQWAQRKPWLMKSPAQFRPEPPPALWSTAWARDYNEVRALGGKTNAKRTDEQTEIALFWEYSLPPIYHAVVRSVSTMPGREVTQNARLFAVAAQAMDDALIAVFDAKYHYHFWRPVTAIRNGDTDDNDATEREPSWTPLIEAPLHPEYPSAHAIIAGALGTVLQAEIGKGASPVLASSSPTAKGVVRRWQNVNEMVREVENARVYEGIHYRTSVDVGSAMGQQIGALAAQRYQPAPR